MLQPTNKLCKNAISDIYEIWYRHFDPHPELKPKRQLCTNKVGMTYSRSGQSWSWKGAAVFLLQHSWFEWMGDHEASAELGWGNSMTESGVLKQDKKVIYGPSGPGLPTPGLYYPKWKNHKIHHWAKIFRDFGKFFTVKIVYTNFYITVKIYISLLVGDSGAMDKAF